VTGAVGFYSADIGNPVRFGGLSINAGAQIDGFSNGWNILYVPQRKLFDGSIGLAVTLPIGHLDGVAQIGPLLTETAGWGFGDVTTRAQLGWQRGDFSHLVYVQAVAPTGRWQPGFTRSSVSIGQVSIRAGHSPGSTNPPNFRSTVRPA
jgi:hypothetical protein